MRTLTLRQRLMFSFLSVAIIPLVAAAAVVVPWYASSIDEEAQRTLKSTASTALELFDEQVEDAADQMASTADSLRGDSKSLAAVDLSATVAAFHLDYAEILDSSGYVRSSTASRLGVRPAWGALDGLLVERDRGGFVDIVPVDELERLGLADETALKVQKTDGGHADQSEAEGALAIVAFAPMTDLSGKRVGTLVGVDILKKDNTIVDTVAKMTGAKATIFQNGVRVATTVKGADGKRAIGTAISDKVRAVAIDEGNHFSGEAPVVGKMHFTDYVTLTNRRDAVVGLLFVGMDKGPYDASVRNFSLAFLGFVLLGAVAAFVFAWFASLYLSRPISTTSKAAERVATGDLTVSVPERGFREAQALSRAFNTMTSGLRGLLTSVSTSVSRLEAVSSEIASTSAQEADAAAQQASAVAETTATVEELDRSFAAVADGARRVLDIAEDSLEVAESGRDAVAEGVGQVDRLANGSNAVLQAAAHLNEVAEEIGGVTFVIASIAEQTKILALNAAIEAARAGKAGKGFGVVASEIRTLADSVTTSIVRIEGMISGIQEATKDLSATAEQQVSIGAGSVTAALNSRKKFDEIYDRMTNTAAAAREIATAASQQQSAARQIVGVMHQVSQGVNGSAQAARSLADAASDVKREASSLNENLRGFRVK